MEVGHVIPSPSEAALLQVCKKLAQDCSAGKQVVSWHCKYCQQAGKHVADVFGMRWEMWAATRISINKFEVVACSVLQHFMMIRFITNCNELGFKVGCQSLYIQSTNDYNFADGNM